MTTGRETVLPSDIVVQLREDLRSEKDVRLAVLFGSRVSKAAHSESDVDIGVEFDPYQAGGRYDLLRRIIPVLSGYFASASLDVIILNEAPPLLRHRVAKGGSVLFEREFGDMQRWVMHAVRDYQDTAYQRNRFLRMRIERLKRG